ncbi:MAG: DMT family transporter [Tissierellaceae bacterium]|nr:DMT family transporter [Tissierellaceae bacterium]
MGLIILILSALFFSVSSYFGKIVTNITSMSGVITSFSRFFLGAVIMFIYIIATKKSFKSEDFKPVFIRAFFNSISIILFSSSLNFTTITNANMLNMTYPVFVVLLVPFLSKEEKIKKITYLYLFLIMLGSYIVADPSFGSVNKGDLLSIISSVTAAISIISLKKCREHNEGYLIVFYVMLIGTFINLPFSIHEITNFEMNGLFFVVIAGLLGFLGQIFITWGYKYVDSATGALISSSRIVLSAIIGIILLNEPLDLNIIIGILLIGGSLVGLSGYFDNKRIEIDESTNIDTSEIKVNKEDN